jgi:hypothetical protein
MQIFIEFPFRKPDCVNLCGYNFGTTGFQPDKSTAKPYQNDAVLARNVKKLTMYRLLEKEFVSIFKSRQPLRAVFRDSNFANSPAKINMGKTFKMLTPDTRAKAI